MLNPTHAAGYFHLGIELLNGSIESSDFIIPIQVNLDSKTANCRKLIRKGSGSASRHMTPGLP